METQPRGQRRPERCSVVYDVQLALRPNRSWEGMVPANKAQLMGWLKAMPYRKKRLAEMIANIRYGSPEAAEEAFNAEVEKTAEHILQEVTWGFKSYGEDSRLHADVRFKRTKMSKLFIGAGNILAALEEAAWRYEDNPGRKRFIKSRAWITPGKVVLQRFQNGRWLFITQPDGRSERNVPPEPPAPHNFFRAKPATIVFAEKVDYPCCLSFWLWTDPEISGQDLSTWFTIAGERGLMRYRQMKQGQFDLDRLLLASPDTVRELLEKEREKEEAKARGVSVMEEENVQALWTSFLARNQ